MSITGREHTPQTLGLPDRRRLARIACRRALSGALIVETENEIVPAAARDLSPDGAGLLLHRFLPFGTRVGLELRSPDGRVCVAARVAYCLPQALSGDYLLGCDFLRRLSAQELAKVS
jgi:hypothetical protein